MGDINVTYDIAVNRHILANHEPMGGWWRQANKNVNMMMQSHAASNNLPSVGWQWESIKGPTYHWRWVASS